MQIESDQQDVIGIEGHVALGGDQLAGAAGRSVLDDDQLGRYVRLRDRTLEARRREER